MAYSPFASSKYETGVFPPKPFMPYGTTLLNDERVKQVAVKNGMSAGQVLLSWAFQRSTLPIFRNCSAQRQRENLELKKLPENDFVTLSGLELDRISGKCTTITVFPEIKVYDW